MVSAPWSCRVLRSLARLVTEAAVLQPLEGRLADRGVVELAHDQAVETVDLALAREIDELNLLDIARLEPDGRAREEIETPAVGFLAIEDEGPVDLEEVEMRADLDRSITRIGDLELHRGAAGVDLEVRPVVIIFARFLGSASS